MTESRHLRLRAPRTLLRLGPSFAVAVLVLALFPASAMAEPTDYFGVTGPSSVTAGVPYDYTVTAYTWGTSTQDTGYGGIVAITSNDGNAVLPSNSTLSGGTGTFGVILETVGSSWSITATDTVTSSITGSQTGIAVTPAAATHFVVTAPSTVGVGSAFTVTVTAKDAYGNTDTNYGGTVDFTSTDPDATLPGDTTLTAGTGTKTFTNAFTFGNVGSGTQTITATDTSTSIHGSASVTVTGSATSNTAVSSGTNPTTYGGSVTFTATVTGAGATPGGTVQFKDGISNLGSAVTLSGGVAHYSISALTAGHHSITAAYSGDTNYATSTSNTVDQNVQTRPITVTANAGQTKVYGASDPTFTYTITSGSLVSPDVLSGSLSRAAGSGVGLYAITQNSLTAGANYNLTFVSNNFSITARPITVTANAGQTKVYGASDPTFTYTITTGSLVGSDAFSGSLSRTAGTGVGTYPINQGTLALSANYTLSFVGANFTITKATPTITFTSTAPSAVVGGPTYSVTVSSPSPATIVLSIDSSASTICSISGSTVSFLAVGTCKIDANQVAGPNWNAAAQVQQSVAVGKGSVPGQPTAVTGIGLNAAAQVSWTAPTNNGGSVVTAYHVTSSPGGKTCNTAGALTCTVTGLTNYTPYTFTVTATNHAGTGNASSPSAKVVPRAGATFVPLTPSRVLDTTAHIQLSTPLTANVGVKFQVTNQFPSDATRNVPSTATAVTGVLSVSHSTAGGFLALTPTVVNTASTSTLNFPAGDARATGVTVPLSATGSLGVLFVAASGTAAVSFDVTGYFVVGTSNATYFALTPGRLLDTRTGNGATKAPLPAGKPLTFQVTGRTGTNVPNVPASAVAVTGTLTVTGQTKAGYLSLGPDALAAPTTASLYFPVGDTRATGLTVKLGTGGKLSVTYTAAAGATTNVIFDVTGFFVPGTAGAMYVPVTPVRILDTRKKLGLPGSLRANIGVTFLVAGRGGVPSTAVAVTGTLTVTNQKAAGYLTLTKTRTNSPTTSTLNFPKGDNRSTGVTVPLGSGGILGIVYAASPASMTTDAIFDVTGYFVQ